jgi:hypothetical protein
VEGMQSLLESMNKRLERLEVRSEGLTQAIRLVTRREEEDEDGQRRAVFHYDSQGFTVCEHL